MNQIMPTDQQGMPVTTSKKPEIVINTLVINLDERLEFLDQNDKSVSFETVAAENNARVLTPVNELTPGRYCLVYSLNPTKDESLYWCLSVDEK